MKYRTEIKPLDSPILMLGLQGRNIIATDQSLCVVRDTFFSD